MSQEFHFLCDEFTLCKLEADASLAQCGDYLLHVGEVIFQIIGKGDDIVVQSLSSVHFGGVARARARRGRISLESETGRVLTV